MAKIPALADVQLHIDWASHEAAKYACENWHYSKSTPVPPLVKVGAWEDGKFIGVILFSRGASSNLLTPYGLKQDQGCELTRVALTKHITPVSRIVKFAIKFLVKMNPKLRLVVSFADPEQGHVGGIYQAGNWVFTGRTSAGVDYYFKGKRLHSRQVSAKGWNIQQGVKRITAKPSECIVKKTAGKYRYLMALDNEMKKQLNLIALPYPKREQSKDSVAADIQSVEGGATPTCSLTL